MQSELKESSGKFRIADLFVCINSLALPVLNYSWLLDTPSVSIDAF